MNTERISGPTLAVFRTIVGLLFSFHGAATLFGWFGGNPAIHAAAPFGVWPMWWSGAIEFTTGLLVVLGILVRPMALFAAGTMAYAYFTVHQQHALLPLQNGGEPAVLFGWAFFLIAVLGPGSWTIGELVDERLATGTPEARLVR